MKNHLHQSTAENPYKRANPSSRTRNHKSHRQISSNHHYTPIITIIPHLTRSSRTPPMQIRTNHALTCPARHRTRFVPLPNVYTYILHTYPHGTHDAAIESSILAQTRIREEEESARNSTRALFPLTHTHTRIVTRTCSFRGRLFQFHRATRTGFERSRRRRRRRRVYLSVYVYKMKISETAEIIQRGGL